MSFLTRLLGNAAKVGVRRFRSGPTHPAWNFALEAAVETLRADGDVNLAGTLTAWRAGQEDAARTTPIARHVVESKRTLGGRPVLQLDPKRPHDYDAVILYLHGGGFCTGSPTTHRSMVSRITAAAGVRTMLLDYRLAPEHPFPAALDDCVAAMRQLYSQGTSPSKIVLLGDSAGGALCMATLARLQSEKLARPAGAALLCPWLDLEGTYPSVAANVKYDWGDRRTLDYYSVKYAPGQLREPLVSPLHLSAEVLAKLPPLLVQYGGGELLRDEDHAFVEKARAAGATVEEHEYAGMVHDWHMFAPLVPQATAAIEELAMFIRKVIVPIPKPKKEYRDSGGGH